MQNDAAVANPSVLTPTLLSVSAPNITLKDAQITAESTGNVAASDNPLRFLVMGKSSPSPASRACRLISTQLRN